jgi:hypothetical protein
VRTPPGTTDAYLWALAVRDDLSESSSSADLPTTAVVGDDDARTAVGDSGGDADATAVMINARVRVRRKDASEVCATE